MSQQSRTKELMTGSGVLIASSLATHIDDEHLDKPDVSAVAEEDIRVQIMRLAQTLDRGTHRLVGLLPEFDKQQVWAADGQRSCAAWLNTYAGLSMSAAHDRCRVAHALETLPIISRLFMLGELSWSKVRALTRIATPDSEQSLASQALLMSASAIEKMARQHRDVQTLGQLKAENEIANEQYQQRHVHYGFDQQGMVTIHALLPPLEGAAVLKSLARAEDEIHLEAQGAPTGSTPHASPYSLPEEDSSKRSQKQLRADALCLMAKKHMAAEAPDVRNADRYQVVVHIDADTLQHSITGGSKSTSICHIKNGPAIAASSARRLADDCSVTPLYLQNGEPLSIGRKNRLWSSAISRAITTRDQHCQFPGCSSARYTHIHHIRHWANGGETSVENGVLLCGFHHRLIHEENYRIEKRTESSKNDSSARKFLVENSQGESITLTAKRPRFRVLRPDGSEV